MKTLWRNFKFSYDIDKIYAHNFSTSICFAWFLYTFSPVIHGNNRGLHFCCSTMGHISFWRSLQRKCCLWNLSMFLELPHSINSDTDACIWIQGHLVSMHPSIYLLDHLLSWNKLRNTKYLYKQFRDIKCF